MSVIDEVACERKRQVEQEGFTAEHDDEHVNGELAEAAAGYALLAAAAADVDADIYRAFRPSIYWPWARSWWKPKSPRRDLIRAAALIVAEIERLDRAASKRKEAP